MSIFGVTISLGGIHLGGKKSKGSCDENVSKIIRDFTCMHQGEFIQYSFLASEFHRKFKEEYIKEKSDQKILEKHIDKLMVHLNEKFASVVLDSFVEMTTEN